MNDTTPTVANVATTATESTVVALPKTGQTVSLNPFVTIGQSRELQKIVLAKSKFDLQTGQVQDMPADAFMAMQDKAAELLITQIRTKDGVVTSFTKEWLDTLPVDDGNIVYEKVNDVLNQSSLKPEEQKKS